jgi:predicted nucleic acid-binding protein
MSVVVDTNVLAYYVLGTAEFVEETQTFWSNAGEPLAPSSWEAELANVVWMAVRTGRVAETDGGFKLELATRLGVHSIAVRSLWQGALARAVASGVPVYDTLFVELAEREQVPLVTFDRKLLAAYPDVAKRPRDLLAS